MPTRLILIRHGQTEWNADGRFMGQSDIALNEIGEQQAEAAARRLASERPTVIYSSDLQRAWCTAQEIQKRIVQGGAEEPAPTLIAEKRLREMHFGDWQGLTYPQIQAKYPEAAEAWETNMMINAPNGGETLIQVSERVRQTYKDIVRVHPDETVFLVAHGGTLQILLCIALEIGIEKFWQFTLNNTSISELVVVPEGAILGLFNDTCHLEGMP